MAKVDQNEIYGPLRERAWMTGVLVLAFVVAGSLGVGFIGRQRDAQWLQNQLAIERKHRLILDTTSQGVLGLDRQGRHVFVNPAACRILGYTPEELIGRTSHDLWHCRRADGSPYPLDECPICAALQSGKPCHRDDEVFFRKDGTGFVAEYTAALTSDVQQPVALVLLFSDGTERKRAEERSALDEARVNTLLELSHMTDRSAAEIAKHAMESAIRLTGSTIGYLAFVSEDETVLTMHYWSSSAMQQCAMIDKPLVYPVKDTGLWGEAIRQRRAVLTNDYAAPNPHKRGTPSGHVHLTRHMNIPVFDGGRIVAVAGVGNKAEDYQDDDARQMSLFMDGMWRILCRKRAEEALTQSNQQLEAAILQANEMAVRAECANRAKSEFLANMSHEIRTPMTAILGFTDILLSSVREPASVEDLQTIKRNGEHLLAIINDILDISKVEAGKLELEMIPWAPRQVVAEVVSLLRVRSDSKGLTLTDEYQGPLPETITTDPARLRQILLNLVGNAIKFTETGGVRIVTRLVESPEGDPKLRFDVIDTGIGIPEEQIESLFEPFTQADGSSRRRFEGTGLGLTISRRLAGLLGGEIAAESTPGRGSTFTVTVATGPLDNIGLVDYLAEASPVVVLPAESNCKFQKELRCRLLLAEDIPDSQRLISSMLSESGVEVTIAQDGQEAVEMALATCPGRRGRCSDPGEPFDVILMDVQMPVFDGHEATRRLRREGYTGPIVALTAHTMQGDRQRCLDAGCDDYLTKPVDRNALMDIVAKWASRQQEHTEATAACEFLSADVRGLREQDSYSPEGNKR